MHINIDRIHIYLCIHICMYATTLLSNLGLAEFCFIHTYTQIGRYKHRYVGLHSLCICIYFLAHLLSCA